MNSVFYRLVAHDGKKWDENQALQYGNISEQIAARDGLRSEARFGYKIKSAVSREQGEQPVHERSRKK